MPSHSNGVLTRAIESDWKQTESELKIPVQVPCVGFYPI